jgi:hypothetical protein
LEKHVRRESQQLTRPKKQCAKFTPYMIVQHYGDIEDEFWKDAAAAPNQRALNSRLHHRSYALYLTGAVLLFESLHKDDVSDFFGIEHPMKHDDVHQPYLMINKANRGRENYARQHAVGKSNKTQRCQEMSYWSNSQQCTWRIESRFSKSLRG